MMNLCLRLLVVRFRYVVSFYFPIFLFIKKGSKVHCGVKKPVTIRYTSASAQHMQQ
jgi:hypothetical protein